MVTRAWSFWSTQKIAEFPRAPRQAAGHARLGREVTRLARRASSLWRACRRRLQYARREFLPYDGPYCRSAGVGAVAGAAAVDAWGRAAGCEGAAGGDGAVATISTAPIEQEALGADV
jgi:hypothetical protein